MKTLSNQKKQSNSKKIAVGIVILLIVLVCGGVYAYTLSKNNGGKKQSQETARKYGSDKTTPTENTPISSGNNNNNSASTPKESDQSDSDPQTNTEVKPAMPVGTFVSNHNPNIDGSPRPNSINSTCSTSANITCYIEFTNGSERRTLGAQKTDANGNTVWNWKLQDIGLTAGTWSVTAVAANGSQEARTKDPIPLEVQE